MDYMTLKEAAEKWGVTPRRVEKQCEKRKAVCCDRSGTLWIFPGETPG